MASTTPIGEQKCLYCNGVPTNHAFHFFETSIDLFVSDFRKAINLSTRMPKWLEKCAIGILLFLNWIFTTARIITYRDDIEKAPGERMRSAMREAQKRGIKVQILHVLGKPIEVFRACLQPKGYKKPEWFYVHSLPIPPWSSREGFEWVDDKKLFNKAFIKAGLPVAQSIVVVTEHGARKAFEKIGAPVIVKPRSGSRARHTTVNITDTTELLAGYHRAKQLCFYTLVESFKPGSVYRATCIGKKVIGVMKLVKPSIIADGTKTVKELFEYTNANKRHANLTDIQDNIWFRDAIAHQGYTLESVPPQGTELFLVEHSERHNGGYFIDITDRVPQESIALIERAAEVCGLDVIGFDIISEDITKPASEMPLTFIEGNTLPFVEIHLTPYEGEPRDTQKALWDLWF